MSFSRIWAFAIVLIGFGGFAGGAAALDAPRTLHSAKASNSHLSEPHRASHHAAAEPAKPPARSNTAHTGTAHAGATHAAPKRARVGQQAHLTARGSARAARRNAAISARPHRYHERFTASSFASGDYLAGDVTAGEDPVVRQAAIDALEGMNGTAVVIDPSNGRILAMVNQKLALSPGAEPCSTIKLTVAMAALSEGLVTRDTPVQLAGFHMNMTQALAKSNNLYFEELGRELGFDRVRH